MAKPMQSKKAVIKVEKAIIKPKTIKAAVPKVAKKDIPPPVDLPDDVGVIGAVLEKAVNENIVISGDFISKEPIVVSVKKAAPGVFDPSLVAESLMHILQDNHFSKNVRAVKSNEIIGFTVHFKSIANSHNELAELQLLINGKGGSVVEGSYNGSTVYIKID